MLGCLGTELNAKVRQPSSETFSVLISVYAVLSSNSDLSVLKQHNLHNNFAMVYDVIIQLYRLFLRRSWSTFV